MSQMMNIDQVQEALDQFNRGYTYLYNRLTMTMKENQTNENWFVALFDELRDHVDLFDQMNEQFLDFLQFQIDWSKQSKTVLDTFGAFQITLISCNTKHTQRYLSFLCTLFAIPETPADHLDFVHETLEQLVRLVPRALTLLYATVEQHVPFATKDVNIQVIYMKNLLRSLGYLSVERSRILEIILSKLIRMDVHASRQDILRAEKGTIEHELVFSLEQLDTNDNDGMKHDQADKLDRLMYVLFEYITNTAIPNEIFHYEQTKSLFRDLLNVFSKILLPTHDSSHVQFLLFYICSFHSDFSEEFLNKCWKIFISPSVSIIFRQSAIYYLCSLIARAKYIPTRSVLVITQLMVDWLHAYVKTTETNSVNPNRHLPFYAICQAVLYIFIYRHQEIARLVDGIETVSQWRLGRIISSELNPLKYCLPAIALRFARLARNYQIVFCYSIIQTNNRYSLPELFTSNDCHSPIIPSDLLDSYFPFDPYVLKHSAIFIRSIYNDYREETDELNTRDSDENDVSHIHRSFQEENLADVSTSMMMSTTPSSFDPINQWSTSFKISRSFLPFGRSPGFRTIP